MAEKVHEIEAHIDRTRERLGSNLKELEQKVDAATDWREQFRARPFAVLAVACAGGVLLSTLLRSKAPRPRRERDEGNRLAPASRRRVDARGQAVELWDNVQDALLGMAAARVKEHIGTLLPGFDDHIRRAEQRRSV